MGEVIPLFRPVDTVVETPEEDQGGPPVGSVAWRCIPCEGVADEAEFAFYCTDRKSVV